ncbi:M20/M25/M40 family metallo-hydrolase [Litorihabitans aurantiacus]|uniref:M20/M25/M40 family metallo-hydrolase n=1 Tax=Litorihabitans aurantiacus TaxID=1930061 RepID=UPI0024E0B393|nr:M20/M25/M40 family metallo-hydrolase [Litorihabitans aurantiacus]
MPDRARLWAELRSTEADWLTGARRRVVEAIGAEASARGVDLVAEWLSDQDPVRADPLVQDLIGAGADALGLSWQAVPSGAGHDAAHLAHLGPMGMIFVPSVGGRSHCPEELTEIDDVVQGIQVLAATLVAMDERPAAAR